MTRDTSDTRHRPVMAKVYLAPRRSIFQTTNGSAMVQHHIAGSLIGLLSVSSAEAGASAYRGVWAASPKHCRAGMTNEDAAFRIGRSTVDGFEWRCWITHIAEDGRGARVALACIRDGIQSERTVSWRLRDGRLIESEDGRTAVFVRCGAPRS
ncbi:hypothetical protein FV232_26015 [Methylobacterium sp. WL30]|uniref:hypothetical protein n=2 Tax=Methylobacterium TaxID=407 RepID=UPI0011CC1D25|nr:MULTISPECIES: hypothetical protein [unclassified Methylobacterium]TXN48323.1 hypothetical protein FV227_20095 [Methylobacterium sp. WL119]TXN62134.1 hypothetical protein FV232_26015 [Methylobacterium sp. WL30]